MRTQALSALLLGGLLVLTATGQGNTVPKTTEVKKATLEDDIARAVRTHPDVQVAEAEAKLANAKLEQAKLAVAQRVAAAKREKDKVASDLATAKSRLDLVQASLNATKAQLDRIQQLHKSGAAPATEVRPVEAEYEKAKLAVLAAEQSMVAEKAKLAEAEAAYDSLVGRSTSSTGALLQLDHELENERIKVFARLLDSARKTKAVPLTGTVADRIRAAMAKRITFECKGISLERAVEELKKSSGLDVIVRIPNSGITSQATFTFAKQELPLSAWFELIHDEMTNYGDPKSAGKIDWFVREYGLTFSEYGRPDGAMSLGEFLKDIREVSEKPKADPQPKK